jgi:hypothetical protein
LCIQCQEEDTWDAILGHVCPNIEFTKGGDSRNSRQTSRPYLLHHKWDAANVGFAFMQIKVEACRKVSLQNLGVH